MVQTSHATFGPKAKEGEYPRLASKGSILVNECTELLYKDRAMER